MTEKMTWEEMVKAFPDEWIRVIDYEMDEKGGLKCGRVVYHSRSKHIAYSQPLTGQSEAFWYTGESTFSGLRSHAENDQHFSII
ncbi:MAG: hypothetical protein Q7T03_08140 [Deltaproteobacteria bacterium]|nr:hypothetical protein [Deltaproteobacteria bacterium]